MTANSAWIRQQFFDLPRSALKNSLWDLNFPNTLKIIHSSFYENLSHILEIILVHSKKIETYSVISYVISLTLHLHIWPLKVGTPLIILFATRGASVNRGRGLWPSPISRTDLSNDGALGTRGHTGSDYNGSGSWCISGTGWWIGGYRGRWGRGHEVRGIDVTLGSRSWGCFAARWRHRRRWVNRRSRRFEDDRFESF